MILSQCEASEVGKLVKALLAVQKQKTLLSPLCSTAVAQLISKVSTANLILFVTCMHLLQLTQKIACLAHCQLLVSCQL